MRTGKSPNKAKGMNPPAGARAKAPRMQRERCENPRSAVRPETRRLDGTGPSPGQRRRTRGTSSTRTKPRRRHPTPPRTTPRVCPPHPHPATPFSSSPQAPASPPRSTRPNGLLTHPPHHVHSTGRSAGANPRRRHPALVAQRIEHLTTDQKVGGSNPSERATRTTCSGP